MSYQPLKPGQLGCFGTQMLLLFGFSLAASGGVPGLIGVGDVLLPVAPLYGHIFGFLLLAVCIFALLNFGMDKLGSFVLILWVAALAFVPSTIASHSFGTVSIGVWKYPPLFFPHQAWIYTVLDIMLISTCLLLTFRLFDSDGSPTTDADLTSLWKAVRLYSSANDQILPDMSQESGVIASLLLYIDTSDRARLQANHSKVVWNSTLSSKRVAEIKSTEALLAIIRLSSGYEPCNALFLDGRVRRLHWYGLRFLVRKSRFSPKQF